MDAPNNSSFPNVWGLGGNHFRGVGVVEGVDFGGPLGGLGFARSLTERSIPVVWCHQNLQGKLEPKRSRVRAR